MDKNDFRDFLKQLTEDRVHGASELSRQCLQIAADSALHGPARDPASLLSLLEERGLQMAAQRPSVAPLVNLLARWRLQVSELKDMALDDARWQAAQLAIDLMQLSRNAVRDVAAHARELVGEQKTVLTHSASSTVLEVFHQLKESGVRAIVTESRPLQLGHRMLAKLSEWAIPTTLITEAQMGLFVRQADCVLVGADSLMPDGTVINNAGTYLLALAAHDQGVPFYVCCESFKRRGPDMGQPVLDEGGGAILGAPDLPHVTAANVCFDLTPAWLVTAWITEQGTPPGRHELHLD